MPYPGVPAKDTAKVERCVKRLLADPNFKPKKGRTKKQSAIAVCIASIKGSNKSKDYDESENFVMSTDKL